MEGITFLENCWISLAIFPFKCFHWCQWCLHFWGSHFGSLSTCTSLAAFPWFPIAPYTVHLWLKFMFRNWLLELVGCVINRWIEKSAIITRASLKIAFFWFRWFSKTEFTFLFNHRFIPCVHSQPGITCFGTMSFFPGPPFALCYWKIR